MKPRIPSECDNCALMDAFNSSDSGFSFSEVAKAKPYSTCFMKGSEESCSMDGRSLSPLLIGSEVTSRVDCLAGENVDAVRVATQERRYEITSLFCNIMMETIGACLFVGNALNVSFPNQPLTVRNILPSSSSLMMVDG